MIGAVGAGARVVQVTAPCPVVLLGSELAAGLAVASERRIECRIESLADGVSLESRDDLSRVESATLSELGADGVCGLVAECLGRLGVERGVRVVTQLRGSIGGPFSPELALGVALAAGVAALRGEPPQSGSVGLAGWVVERGGGVAWRDGRQRDAELDAGRIEESFFLVPDAQATTRDAVAALDGAEVDAWLEAFRRWDHAAMAGVLQRAWPRGSGRVADLVRSSGGCARSLGAGQVLCWTRPGRADGSRAGVEGALGRLSLRWLPLRVDLRGLVVQVEPP